MEQILNRINHKINAVSIVDETNYFSQPTIQMVLIKKLKNREKFIISVIEDNDFNKPYLVRPHKKKKVVTSSIHYKNDGIADECIEGYVLFCLSNGYQLSFISVPLIISVWEYIEIYCYKMNYTIKGVKEFLLYCQQIGVIKELLDYYGDTEREDLYAIFLNGNFNEDTILLKQCIGDSVLILGYQEYFNTLLYTVFVIDDDSSQINYKEHHSLIDSALTDFMRLFYDLSILYYRQTEKDIKETVSHFIEFLEENE